MKSLYRKLSGALILLVLPIALNAQSDAETAMAIKQERILKVQKELKPVVRKKSQSELEEKLRAQLPGKASKAK